MNYLLKDVQVVAPRGIQRQDLYIVEGIIASPSRAEKAGRLTVVNGRGLYALPGFVDIHTHGGLGFDATEGVFEAEHHRFNASARAFREALPRLMRHLARRGVTRALLATLAAPIDRLEHALGLLGEYVESERNGRDGAILEGVFIEGSFIKNPACAGAQNPANFLPPRIGLFRRLQRAARGHIRYVNVPPEHGPAGERLMRYLSSRGILVGMGHTSCPAEQVLKCQQLGLRICVHFLNGPTGSSFKPFGGGNVVQAVLKSRKLYAEIICDGWHSAPAYVMDIFRRKGADRIVAVTDSVFAAGATGIEEFTLGGIRGRLHESGEYIHTAHDQVTLFGSVLDMARAFENLLNWHTKDMRGIWYRHAALPLDRALVLVAKCCATQPARLLGLHRRRDGLAGTGVLLPGRAADVALVRLTGRPGGYKVRVVHTFVNGRKVF